jgi:hypothetical protein
MKKTLAHLFMFHVFTFPVSLLSHCLARCRACDQRFLRCAT